MQEGLATFGSEAKRIMDLFCEVLPKERSESHLYHYTDEAGLKGILRSGKLWLTEISRLNDPSELNHGFEVGIGVLKAAVMNGSPYCKKFADLIEAFYKQMGIRDSAQFFVGSFSWHREDLCQWRAYGDDGRGYALEFDVAAIDSVVERQPPTEAFPLTYADSRLQTLDGEIVEAFRRLVDIDLIMQSKPEKEDLADVCTGLLVQLLRAAVFFKHEAYENEREYRLLQTYMARTQNPEIRHIELDWKSTVPRALKAVIVGPGEDQENRRQCAQNYLRSLHSESVTAVCSAIPYRAKG